MVLPGTGSQTPRDWGIGGEVGARGELPDPLRSWESLGPLPYPAADLSGTQGSPAAPTSTSQLPPGSGMTEEPRA